MEGVERGSVRVLPSGLMSRRDAADYLGRKPGTLALWARLGSGPSPVSVMGRAYYRFEDVQRFAAGQRVAA